MNSDTFLLPWHLGGNLVCDTDRTSLDYWDETSSEEPEANRFAGELLVPSRWLHALIADRGHDRVEPLLEAIFDARVSAHVACLRLLRALPAGHIFAIVDYPDRVVLSGQTHGTGIQAPPRGERLDRNRLDRFATSAEDVLYGSRRVIWWGFHGRLGGDEVDADPRDARHVLAGLLDRHAEDGLAAERMRKTLAGIIGSANSRAGFEGRTARDELYVRFRSRFAPQRDIPESMLDDPDFELWLRKRADELAR